MAKAITLAGSLAQRPRRGGHTWVFLQYLLGFKALGKEVTFVDRLEPEMCTDEAGRQCPLEESVNLRYMEEVMRRFELDGRWSLLYDGGSRHLGLSREELLDRVGRSAFILNVNGFLADEEVLARAPLRVFLDIDPGFGQMWNELGLSNIFEGHDAYVTIGENLGAADCAVPDCGLEWITTPQPVVLDRWPAAPASGDSFTSIGSWRGPFAPIEYQGKTYGLRVHETRKFAALPRLVDEPFEMALDIDAADATDVALLRENGWQLVDPVRVAGDPWIYQDYIRRSLAEFMVAKSMYVEARSGWFSDRSICYLATGRPVLAQDTGFERSYPTGDGLLSFRTLEDASAGAADITARYPEHVRAARAVAERYFDSRKVLSRLLESLGVA
jgi:hypothetical protein